MIPLYYFTKEINTFNPSLYSFVNGQAVCNIWHAGIVWRLWMGSWFFFKYLKSAHERGTENIVLVVAKIVTNIFSLGCRMLEIFLVGNK